MSDQSAHEPTMEEILASIRRIISEDDAPAEEEPKVAAPAVKAPEPEPEAAFEPEPEPEPVFEAEEELEDVLELTEPVAAPRPSVSIGDIDAFDPEPVPAPKPVPAAPKPAAALVSERTEAVAASAFGSLTGALLVPQSDRTLEDVTRDLLRPLLQAWLDDNLPGIVEEQVRLEVERIARQSRR
jgi:uncharacterized protein